MKLSPAVGSPFTLAPRERVDLNAGWRFAREEDGAASGALDYFTGSGVREAVLASAGDGLQEVHRRLGAEEPRSCRMMLRTFLMIEEMFGMAKKG